MIHNFIVGGWDLVNIPGDGSTTQSWSLNSDQFREEKLRGSPAFFTLETTLDVQKPSRFIISVCIYLSTPVKVYELSACDVCVCPAIVFNDSLKITLSYTYA